MGTSKPVLSVIKVCFQIKFGAGKCNGICHHKVWQIVQLPKAKVWKKIKIANSQKQDWLKPV